MECCKKCSWNVSHKSQEWLNKIGIPEHNREITIKANNKTYVVDGLDRATNTVYEFYGDFWHGNPKVFNQYDINRVTKNTFGELYKKTLKKEKNIKVAGYKLITIWEQEFDLGMLIQGSNNVFH